MAAKEVFRPQEDWWKTTEPLLRVANPLKRINDVSNSLEVDQSNGKEASIHLERMLKKALKAGKQIIIDDHTHGRVYGIRKVPSRVEESIPSRKVEVTIVDRFHPHSAPSAFVGSWGNTNIIAGFTEDGEVIISIKRNSHPFEISSNGKWHPKGFTVSIGDELVLARADVRNTLTGVYAHEGPLRWIIKGVKKGQSTS